MFEEIANSLASMTVPDKCPHCGAGAAVKKTKHKRFPYYVYCSNASCACRTARWNTYTGAVKAWNRRGSNG